MLMRYMDVIDPVEVVEMDVAYIIDEVIEVDATHIVDDMADTYEVPIANEVEIADVEATVTASMEPYVHTD